MHRSVSAFLSAILLLSLTACGASPAAGAEETAGASESVSAVDYDSFAGDYVDVDDGETELKITADGSGAFSVYISIFRLTVLEDGIGIPDGEGLAFTATDASGNPITGIIRRDGDKLVLTFTDSSWELIENGTTFTFARTDG